MTHIELLRYRGQLIDWEQHSQTCLRNGLLNQQTTHGHVSILLRHYAVAHAIRLCFDLPSTTSSLHCILVSNGMDTLQ